jgi:hypothetical protein
MTIGNCYGSLRYTLPHFGLMIYCIYVIIVYCKYGRLLQDIYIKLLPKYMSRLAKLDIIPAIDQAEAHFHFLFMSWGHISMTHMFLAICTALAPSRPLRYASTNRFALLTSNWTLKSVVILQIHDENITLESNFYMRQYYALI